MVLVIVAIAIAGVVTAFLLKTNTGNGLGSQYKITKLKDNTLIEKGQTDTCTISIVCDTILNNTDNLNEQTISTMLSPSCQRTVPFSPRPR